LFKIITFTEHGLKVASMLTLKDETILYYFGSKVISIKDFKSIENINVKNINGNINVNTQGANVNTSANINGNINKNINDNIKTEVYLKDCIKEAFYKKQGLIFISACGIAVRLIAPHLKNKKTDIPVVVIDDGGHYVISLLSGHEGGANKLASEIAANLKIDSIITTGTESTKNLIIGIGYRKNTSHLLIEKAVLSVMSFNNLNIKDVRIISTVDIKAKDLNLKKFAINFGLQIKYIERNKIQAVEHNYNFSKIVKKNINVGNVCEAAAILGGIRTELIVPKTIFQSKVAVAIAREKYLWEA